MMVKSVFISRTLAADSPLRAYLEQVGATWYGESLIDFQPVPFYTVPECDWVFFYSRNAVRFFLSQLRDRQLPLTAQLAVMGNGTLKQLKEFGKGADFAGNGRPEDVAQAFALVAKGSKVLFPRAMDSRKSVQRLVQEQLEVIDLVVYSNTGRSRLSIPPVDVLIFTSPKSAQTYYSNYPVSDRQEVLAIGPSTATALRELGVKNIRIAERAGEESLLTLLQRL